MAANIIFKLKNVLYQTAPLSIAMNNKLKTPPA